MKWSGRSEDSPASRASRLHPSKEGRYSVNGMGMYSCRSRSSVPEINDLPSRPGGAG